MYNTSAAFKTAMAQPSRELTARGTITFPDATTHALTPTEISKFTITENAGDHLPLGGVSASTLTLVLDNRLGEWEPGGSILGTKSLDGAIVELEIGVNNSGYEYANAGVFVIEKPVSQEQDAIITLKGSDYLANRALRAFSDTLTYPQTVLQIVTEACLQANITLKTTMFVNSTVSIPVKPVWDENTTCRDVISYVACLAGGFARIDRNGDLEIISFANQAEGLYSQLLDSSFEIVDGDLVWTHPAGYTGPAVTLVGSDLFIDEENIARLNDGEFQFIGTFDGTNYYVHPNRYKKLTNQGVMFGPFNALSVYEYGAPNGYGATRIADDIDIVDNELNSAAVRGNPLLAYGGAALTTLMTNMLNSLGGLEYYAASIEWQGDPSITCGDMVTISNLKGEAYNVLITNQTLTFDNGFTMVTGNRLNTAVVGKAKVENLRVFTPTGKLNAAALEGDINIRAGRQLNLLAGADIKVKSGANIDIEAGGKINVSAGSDFNVRAGKQNKSLGISNNEANGYMLWAGASIPAQAPFSVTMDGSLKAINLDGAFILGVENGGTGETVNRTHRGSTVPSNSFGQDGDLYVLFNGAVGTTWNDTNLTFGSNTQSTYFGVNRNWNYQQATNYRRIGNGTGSASYDFGTYGSFVCPAATKTLNFKFTTTKYVGGRSLSSGVTSYRVALVSSLTGTILATTTVDASTSAILREVTLTTASNLTQGAIYYLGIYYPDTTELNGAAVYGNIVLKGSTSSTVGSALYVKTNGAWVRLAYA